MDQLIAATIIIGDRSYRIKLNPKDEEVVRRTVKIINDKIIEYKTQFAGKDMQDYIAMVLIWLATEQRVAGSADIQQETLTEKLSAIERLLDSQWLSFITKERLLRLRDDLKVYCLCLLAYSSYTNYNYTHFIIFKIAGSDIAVISSISFPFVSSPIACLKRSFACQ